MVAFIVDGMANALELGMAGEFVQFSAELWRFEIHPSDNAEDPRMLICETKQPVSFTGVGSGLHGDASIEVVAGEDGLQIGRQVVAAERGRVSRHPRVREAGEFPEVLVRVDAHR